MDSLRGITAGNWWRLLRREGFGVDREYLGHAAALTRISLFNARVRRRELRDFGDAIAAAKVQAPLFVLGHWRSGTTLLHELLTLDPQWSYPNNFEVSNPHTFLTRQDRILHLLQQEEDRNRPMDNVRISFASPAEDEIAGAMMSLRSPLIAWAFPRRQAYYDRYYSFRGVPADEVAEWRAGFLWFLQKLTVRYGDRRLCLKSPPHTARVKLLLEMFPDAKFVHIHRNPFHVFRSTTQLYQKAVPFSYMQRTTEAETQEGIFRRYRLVYDAFLEDRALIPAGQYCEVAFEELERDLVCQVARVYEQLGLTGLDAALPRLQAYARDKAGYQKNEHTRIAEPLRSRIIEEWRPCFDEWGYAVT